MIFVTKELTFERYNTKWKTVPEEDEAFYGYYAISHTTDIEDGVSVDIGGGSTEVTLFKDKSPKN
jgi:exopolyphosphatase/guanosine-5'-triphosphate,3'-diphosphate pyrophosphatase